MDSVATLQTVALFSMQLLAPSRYKAHNAVHTWSPFSSLKVMAVSLLSCCIRYSWVRKFSARFSWSLIGSYCREGEEQLSTTILLQFNLGINTSLLNVHVGLSEWCMQHSALHYHALGNSTLICTMLYCTV